MSQEEVVLIINWFAHNHQVLNKCVHLFLRVISVAEFTQSSSTLGTDKPEVPPSQPRFVPLTSKPVSSG